MSILNITNLTDNPEKWIEEKYIDAFEEVEKELNISIDDTERHDFIATQIDYLEETMEESLGKDLLGIIDNYLVNLDYYSEVKEYIQNNRE
jgi:ABC-type phosphate/phosphonate transport system substrate-binding protein